MTCTTRERQRLSYVSILLKACFQALAIQERKGIKETEWKGHIHYIVKEIH